MKFIHLIKTRAPKYCGVHPSFGKIAELIHETEELGAPEFAADSFQSPRERALMYAPYQAQAIIGTHEHVLDLIEYAICQHRYKEHGDNYAERIDSLKTSLGESPELLEGETLEAGTRGWWNN